MRAIASTVAALVVLLPAAAGCGGEGKAAPPPDVAEGYVVDVAGEGDDVPSFTLQIGTREYEVLIDDQVDYGFRLGHLREHERLRDPVRCVLEQRDGKTYALRIDDVQPPR